MLCKTFTFHSRFQARKLFGLPSLLFSSRDKIGRDLEELLESIDQLKFSFYDLEMNNQRFQKEIMAFEKKLVEKNMSKEKFFTKMVFFNSEILKKRGFFYIFKDYLLSCKSMRKVNLFLFKNYLIFSKKENDMAMKTIFKANIREFIFEKKSINELAIIHYIYYDCLKSFFKISQKEHQYYKSKKIQLHYESEFKKKLGLNFEQECFSDFIEQKFFENLIEPKYRYNGTDILYFFTNWIIFSPLEGKLESYLQEFLGKNNNDLNLNELTHFYTCLINSGKNKLNIKYFEDYLRRVSVYLKKCKREKNGAVTYTRSNNLILNKSLYNELIEEEVEETDSKEISEPNTDSISLNYIIDLYWTLTRNYCKNFESVLYQLTDILSINLQHLSQKDKILYLYSKAVLSFQISENPWLKNFEYEFEILMNEINKNINIFMKNLKNEDKRQKILGTLFLSLRYLSLIGYEEKVKKYFPPQLYQILIKEFSELVEGNSEVSYCENKIANKIKEIVESKNNLKVLKVEFQKKIDIYKCDVLVCPSIIIEINGDLHDNYFYKFYNDEVICPKFNGKFNLKKQILNMLNYQVYVISSDEYLKVIHNKELENFLNDFLKKILKE